MCQNEKDKEEEDKRDEKEDEKKILSKPVINFVTLSVFFSHLMCHSFYAF